MIDSRLRKHVQFIFDFLASGLGRAGLTPNQLTLIGFAFGVLCGIFFLLKYYIASLILLWLSGLFDVLDGSLARIKGTSTALGAFMDMIFDRVVEVLFVIAFAIVQPGGTLAVMVFLGAVIFNFSTFMLAGSLFQNEGEKSIHYDPGLAERTETFLVFTLILLFPYYGHWFLWTFNALILWTGAVRVIKIYHHVTEQDSEAHKGSSGF